MFNTISHTAHVCQIQASLTQVFLFLKYEKEIKIESSNFRHNGAFLPLKMLMRHCLKCPYLHFKLQNSPEKNEEAWEKSKLLFFIHQRCSAVDNVFAKNCNARFRLQKRCITITLHLFIQCHAHILVVIMKRQIPWGICCSGSTKDKSNPNRTTIHIQKVLVLSALLSSSVYPEDLSTS